MRNTDITALYCTSDLLFLPDLDICFPAALNLRSTIDDFMLHDEAMDSANTNRTKSVINIRHLSKTKEKPFNSLGYPQFKRIFRGPNPGQSYDHSAIRFNPMSGSTLWISECISEETNYFSNMVRPLISHAAATNGCGLLHSALINVNNFGILLAGQSCSGKSSLALFSMLSNAKTVSDDMVLVAKDGNEFHGKGFRSSFMARSATFKVLPAEIQKLAITVKVDGETKHLLPRDRLSHLSATRSPINALVFPKIDTENKDSNKSYQLNIIEKSQAISRLLPCLDTTVLMPGLDQERVMVTQLLVNITRQLPCLEVTMTPRFLENPAANTARLIDDISSITG